MMDDDDDDDDDCIVFMAWKLCRWFEHTSNDTVLSFSAIVDPAIRANGVP